MSAPWFNVRKAAQIAAFFAMSEGGKIGVLKLTKLIYLSDREFMDRHEAPMLRDRLVSMPHGPVNSMTYNYICGTGDTDDAGWRSFVSAREQNEVAIVPNLTLDSLDELSDAEVEVLQDVYRQFGHLTGWQLRQFTHENCPEWEDPDGSSNPIPYERVFKYLGKQHSHELSDQVRAERDLEQLFASL